MIEKLTIEKDKIAIVVVGYNKKKGLLRILQSVNDADYDEDDVPLIISIDASGNKEVYDVAQNFDWKHGAKIVNIEEKRLGLKNHIFQCASLSKYYKGVIVLEDDLLVSPFYYQYAKCSLKFYENDKSVSGIALYSPEMNGFVGLPFQPLHNEYDVYACQSVCSWGQIWNERMWFDFKDWLEKWDENFNNIDMPSRIKSWTRAWSKYFYAYIISTNRYFIYPYNALSTNFNDAGGEHGGGNSSIVQVPLLMGKRNYHFGELDRLVHYDVYSQNLELFSWLCLTEKELTVDFYGLKSSYSQFVLTPMKLPFKLVRGFALSMRPWELNVKYNIEGEDFFLYDRGEQSEYIPPRKLFNCIISSYFLKGFNEILLLKYVPWSIWSLVNFKVKQLFK